MKNRRVSLADYVFARLEESILAEDYPPGQALTELAISQELKVSRTPVREAFRRLQQEGYLIETAKGNVVVAITPRDMMDIYEIRLRTEGLATRWAAERITDQGLLEILETIELQEFYTSKDDPGHIQEQDDLFHHLIFKYCGSPILGDMLSALHRRIRRYRLDSVSSQDRAGQAAREHRAIYEALARRDADAAESLALEHVKKAKEHIGSDETYGIDPR